ncbi:hypothetical protein ON010_g11991 [Phytophthora cinnamomi]|nr:hypothetical protein ON010_g11991 [Phytophthora cinnamomi]
MHRLRDGEGPAYNQRRVTRQHRHDVSLPSHHHGPHPDTTRVRQEQHGAASVPLGFTEVTAFPTPVPDSLPPPKEGLGPAAANWARGLLQAEGVLTLRAVYFPPPARSQRASGDFVLAVVHMLAPHRLYPYLLTDRGAHEMPMSFVNRMRLLECITFDDSPAVHAPTAGPRFHRYGASVLHYRRADHITRLEAGSTGADIAKTSARAPLHLLLHHAHRTSTYSVRSKGFLRWRNDTSSCLARCIAVASLWLPTWTTTLLTHRVACCARSTRLTFTSA